MGPFLGCFKGFRKREESSSFKIYQNKEKLEKDKVKDNSKNNQEETLKLHRKVNSMLNANLTGLQKAKAGCQSCTKNKI